MEETNDSTPRNILRKCRRRNALAQLRAIENPDDIEAAMAAHAAMLESRLAYRAMIKANMESIVKQINDE